MNLSQLYYFKELVRFQNYTKAAKVLYITQPTLSNAVASLERELGIALFERVGNATRLTTCGEEFYRYVEVALTELDQGVEAVRKYKERVDGLVNLGVTFTVENDYLPKLLSAYHASRGSDVPIYISQGFTNELIKDLRAGKLDLAFCGKGEDEPDMDFFPVLPCELVLAVRVDHELSSRNSVRFEDLKDYKVFTYRADVPIGRKVKKVLAEHGVENVVQFYNDDIAMASVIASSGTTAALMLESVGMKLFPDLCTISVEGIPRDFYWVYLVCCKTHYQSPVTESLIKFIRSYEGNRSEEYRSPRTEG